MVECAPDDDALHARLLTPRCRKALYVLTDMVLGCSRSMTVLALQRPGGTNYFCVLRCALQHAVCRFGPCLSNACLLVLLVCQSAGMFCSGVWMLHMECRQGLTDGWTLQAQYGRELL